jgi:hypothetical protein
MKMNKHLRAALYTIFTLGILVTLWKLTLLTHGLLLAWMVFGIMIGLIVLGIYGFFLDVFEGTR